MGTTVSKATLPSESSTVSTKEALNPLIILDWDDTLFPTTWTTQLLQRKPHQSGSSEKALLLSRSETRELNRFSSKLYSLLVALLQEYPSSRIKIITTSSIGWPQHGLLMYQHVGKYFNAIYNLLFVVHRIDFIHPKTSDLPFQTLHDSVNYKVRAFKLAYNRSKHNSSSDIDIGCIVSIGDGICEYMASKQVGVELSKEVAFVHRIKFLSSPSLQTLSKEMHVLSSFVANGIFNRWSANHQELDFNLEGMKTKI